MSFGRSQIIGTLANAPVYGSVQAGDRILLERPGDALPGYIDPANLLGLTLQGRIKTPYDYGAVAGSEMSADNVSAVNAMFAAVRASFNTSSRTYDLVPSFAGVFFRCDDEVWVGGFRSPAMMIFGGGGGIYSKAAGKIAFNMALCNRVSLLDFTVYGDPIDTPAYGIYWGKALEGSIYPDCRGINFTNCATRGYFTQTGGLGFSSETHSQVNCFWQNKARPSSAFALAIVGHRSIVDKYFTGFSSANCTFPTVAASTQSNLGHELTGVQVERGAEINLTVISVSKALPAVVEVAAGTLATVDLNNGDTVRFSVTGMSELRLGEYTVANIDLLNDTFELAGTDSTLFGTFTGGTVQSTTGPAVLFNGVHNFQADTLYTLAYATRDIVIDMSSGSALRKFHMGFQPERWVDNVIELIAPASGTQTCQNVNFINMSSNQQYGDSVFKYTGAGNITIDGGRIEVINLGVAPPNKLFDDASRLSLRNMTISSQISALLNPASDYVAYSVKEFAYDRFPIEIDYTEKDFVGAPTVADDFIAVVGSYIDTEFQAIGHHVNIVNKRAGACRWDATSSRPVFSAGANASAVWRFADGTLAYTPI